METEVSLAAPHASRQPRSTLQSQSLWGSLLLPVLSLPETLSSLLPSPPLALVSILTARSGETLGQDPPAQQA